MKQVPIFPLPNTVFFPRVKLPLHVFEPRYRQMTEDALAGDRLIVVALLKPGWDKDYYGIPPVHETATVGYVEQHESLPDGRYNIVLDGRERVRLVEEGEAEGSAPSGKLYRVSWTVAVPEEVPPLGSSIAREGSIRLRTLWQRLIDEIGAKSTGDFPVAPEASYEEIVNQIATFAALPPDGKQSLLEQDKLVERAQALESALEEQMLYWSAVKRFRDLSPDDPRLN